AQLRRRARTSVHPGAAPPPATTPLSLATSGLLSGLLVTTREGDHAFGVSRHGIECHAELGGGELQPTALGDLDDPRLLRNVRTGDLGAAAGAARAGSAAREMEYLADLRELALHFLVRLELIDQAALEASADAGELGEVQRQILLFGHADGDVGELVQPRGAAQRATTGAHAAHDFGLVARADLAQLDARPEPL